ncbi:MAG: single-stranded-DNA-specific exonuclease RecJ [Bacteroidota bacterium]
MNWNMKPAGAQAHIEKLAADLSGQRPFPLSLARVFYLRGLHSYNEVRDFCRPGEGNLHDPFLMNQMDIAVDRLIQVIEKQESILLFGDYDVDGTTAVALMSCVCQDLGILHHTYIPDRYKEGYGLSYQGIDAAVEAGAKVLITLDCGIKAFEKVRYATTKGIDVIICDHHNPADTLPEALAVLDPKIQGNSYPFKELTGCGVGMKLASGLVSKLVELGFSLPETDYSPVKKYADLLALSIACDLVPITGENRILANLGLEKLRTNPHPGIAILMRQSRQQREWDISDLVFFIGPRINAAGRLKHGKMAVEVLKGQAENLEEIASLLESENDKRKEMEQHICAEAATAIAQNPSLKEASSTVLFDEKWNKGVIGIVASRLIEQYYRPTVMLTRSNGYLVGSARSVAGFDLYQALQMCDEHILQWGGHTYAAGLTLEEAQLSAFTEAFEQAVNQTIRPEQKVPSLWIDAEVDFRTINLKFINTINRLAPFGPGNRRPVFQTMGVKVLRADILKEKHVRFMLEQNDKVCRAIGFNLAEKWFSLKSDIIDIAYQPTLNKWKQQVHIDLRLKDIKSSYES